jgi:hypothetical protein
MLGDASYDILDLTLSMILSEMNVAILILMFTVMVGLRYYTISCLIYVMVKAPTMWEWIFVIIAIRLIYFLLVVRISIKTAESKTEIILKTHWNSREADVHEMFEEIDFNKLMVSFLRGLIPP